MKKILFSLMSLVALVVMAGSVMAQSSTTPYAGSTYSYTVGGIDAGTTTRKARIYYTTDAAPGAQIIIGDGTSITIGTTTTEPGTAVNAPGAAATDAWDITLPIGATSVTFEATYGTSVALEASRIWIEVYNDAAGAECSNTMYLGVTPAVGALDYDIVADAASVCPTSEVPTASGQDGIADNTVVSYTVTRTGGVTAYNWSFDFDGSTVQVTGGTNTKVVTTSVANIPGTVQTATSVISNFTQYVGTTTVVNSISDTNSGNNSAETTINLVPSIGSFTGN